MIGDKMNIFRSNMRLDICLKFNMMSVLFLKHRNIPYVCVCIYIYMYLINHPHEILSVLQQPWSSEIRHFDLTPSTRPPRCRSPSGSLKRSCFLSAKGHSCWTEFLQVPFFSFLCVDHVDPPKNKLVLVQ